MIFYTMQPFLGFLVFSVLIVIVMTVLAVYTAPQIKKSKKRKIEDENEEEPVKTLEDFVKGRLLNAVKEKPAEYFELLISADTEAALKTAEETALRDFVIENDSVEIDVEEVLEEKPRECVFKLAGATSETLTNTIIAEVQKKAALITEEDITIKMLKQFRAANKDNKDGEATPEEKEDFTNNSDLVGLYLNEVVEKTTNIVINKIFPHEMVFERCAILIEDFDTGVVTDQAIQIPSNKYKIRLVEGDEPEVFPGDCLDLAVSVDKINHVLKISAKNGCENNCFVIIPRFSPVGSVSSMILGSTDQVKPKTFLFLANKNDSTHFQFTMDKQHSVGCELDMLIFSERNLRNLPDSKPRPLSDADILASYGKRLGTGVFTTENLVDD
ncbi:envelope protein [White spot syndrome virus]|uniref:Envelope protein n=1 Tax=White spot syndrome virus TaxID=342409 RepID=A0A2U9QW38_9VIRU|nr:envelope protein [White spot syndrome virus]